MPERADFSTVFSKLKAILQPYASKLVVIADTPMTATHSRRVTS